MPRKDRKAGVLGQPLGPGRGTNRAPGKSLQEQEPCEWTLHLPVCDWDLDPRRPWVVTAQGFFPPRFIQLKLQCVCCSISPRLARISEELLTAILLDLTPQSYLNPFILPAALSTEAYSADVTSDLSVPQPFVSFPSS